MTAQCFMFSGSEPLGATRYSNCGHVFCKRCIIDDSKCLKCGASARPSEIRPDHMVANLARCCNIIADIIDEKSLWNTSTNRLDSSQMSMTTPYSQTRSTSTKKFTMPRKNINKRNAKGETLLHTACLKNQEHYVKALLVVGANPNTKDNANWTPLQEVVNFGYTNICQLLLEGGALPNVPGVNNRTPLHGAAIANRLSEAKILLRYYASKNVYDQYGKKPIDYSWSKEMQEILMETGERQSTLEKAVNLGRTLNNTLSCRPAGIVVFASNLKEENVELLSRMASKHKIKIASTLLSSVSHVIVESNDQNTVNLSYHVMIAILRGVWLLNSEWITLGLDLDDISEMDLELFEVRGAPISGVPKKARENAQNQNPGLFNRCNFYFALKAKSTYYVNEVELTRDRLTKLVIDGDGTVLTRAPDPETIKNEDQVIPFHTAHDSSHALHKCTHYIIYAPGTDEPGIKYNMPHIKTLPLMWLIECIERFTLADPSDMGLL